MTRFYVTGGTLQRDAPSYVQRRADQDLYVGLTQGRFCYVLTSRQMGKSSLMVRTATRLRDEGVAVGVLDLTAIGQNVTAAQWYAGLLGLIGQQLDLEDELEEFWLSHERIGPLQRWMRGIREVVLHRYDSRLVIFVDEIDTVRSLPFPTDEFFAAIREFYNHRTEDAELGRLTFCLLGVATPAELIRDTRTTPFNIGQRVELVDFTEAEAATLAQGLGREESLNISLLKRILYWTGGHPYLTQRLCQAVAEDPGVTSAQGMDRLCEALFFASRAREQDDNLLFVRERILRSEVDLGGLLALYTQIHSQKPVRDDDTSPLISILRLSGITHVVGGFLYVRNRIYYRVFDLEWVRQIEKEIRSQAEEREKQKQPAPKPKRSWQAVLASSIGVFLLALAGYVALPGLMGGGELLVMSEPGNSLILLNGEMKGITSGGKLRLSGLRPGTYTIVARKEGYADKSEYITIKRGMNPDRKIFLYPAQAFLIVQANQPGVRIFLDGKDSGSVTGPDGSATVAGVSPGRHSLFLSKEGFAEWKENRDFAVNRTTEINTSLKPLEIPSNVAVLRITSDPSEASVVVRGADGGKQGTTSGGSLTLQGLKPGTVKVLVESDGYEKKEMSIALAAGRATTQHFVLIPKPAVLQLATTPPVADALVKIDGLGVGRTDRSGVLRMTVQPGKSQVVEVAREGFERDMRLVEFKPGKTVDLSVSLNPRASIPSTGTLSVSSAPAEAEVFVDDRRVGLTPTDMLQVAPGRHKITLKKEGYRDNETILEFRAGEPKPLSYPLEKEVGRLDIVTEPPGVTASIDGQNYIIESQKEISLAPGLYTVHLAKGGYASQQHKVTIVDRQSVPLRVKLNKAAALDYSDEFRDLKNWECEANWPADGVLHARGAGTVFLKDRVFRNFTQRVQLRLLSGTSASLIVRAKDRQNFCLIQVNGDQYWDPKRRKTISFYVYKGGKEIEIEHYPLPVEPKKMKQWFDIIIEASDNRFKVKVSGNVLTGTDVREAQLGTFTDPENLYPEGTIGFRASRDEEFEIAVVVIKSSN